MTDIPNPPKIVAQLPPMTPLRNVSRSPQEIAADRGQISALVETFLDGYWQSDMSHLKRNLILTDWCDELDEWPVDSIRAALRQWRRANPNKKPNPSHISGILELAWGKHNVEQTKAAGQRWQPPPPPVRPPLSDRKAICADLHAKFPRMIKLFPEVEG